MLITFVLIGIAWVFFRANSFADATYVFTHIAVPSGGDVFAPFAAGLLPPTTEFILACALIAFLLAAEYVGARGVQFAAQPRAFRWLAYYCLTAAIIASGWYGTGAAEFIYFQF